MLKRIAISITIFLQPCLATEQETAISATTPVAAVDKKIPMLDLLPVGSVLTRVSIPQYKGPQLSLLLTAERMKIASEQEIAGNAIHIYLYGKEGTPTCLTSAQASLFPDKKLIVSPTETTVAEDRLYAKGSSLYLNTETKQGFLTGPAQTIISTAQLDQSTKP